MYASAITLLERHDGDTGASYLELAEFISSNGAQGYVDTDIKQLFRRVVFNVLVGNRHDHLRNHGFIREPSGWCLSPAFDINPNRSKGEHAVTIDGYDATPNIQAVMATAEFYRLTKVEAEGIKEETIKAIIDWRSDAERLGLSSRSDFRRGASRFRRPARARGMLVCVDAPVGERRLTACHTRRPRLGP